MTPDRSRAAEAETFEWIGPSGTVRPVGEGFDAHVGIVSGYTIAKLSLWWTANGTSYSTPDIGVGWYGIQETFVHDQPGHYDLFFKADYTLVTTPPNAVQAAVNMTNSITLVAVTNIVASTNHIAVGTNVILFTAQMTPVAAGEHITWVITNGGATLTTNQGLTTAVVCDTSGEFTVTATCGSSSASTTIKVYAVSSVTASDEFVAAGDAVTFTATMTPSDEPDMLDWTVVNGTIISQDGMSITVSNSSPGDVVVIVECGASAATATAIAVGVKRIEYAYQFTGEGWTSGSPPFVLQGTPVLFRAIPDPETATFPANKPVWSGTSGASASGPAISVRFYDLSTSASDAKTVIATLGKSSVTQQCVVFNTSLTMVADDNFAGRAASKFGIGEEVHLTNNLVPLGLSPDAVGITFFPPDYPALTVDAGGRVAHIRDCYDARDDYSVALMWKGQELAKKDFSFVVPTEADYILLSQNEPLPSTAGPGTSHQTNTVSAGRQLWVWIKPSDVSFYKLTYIEGFAPYRPFGGVTQVPTWAPGNHDPSSVGLTKGFPNQGSRSALPDTSAWFLGNPPLASLATPGGEDLTIPIGYIIPSLSQTNWFGTVDFKGSYDATGKCSCWKQSTNKSWSAEFGFPTSGFRVP